jgi:predicted O-methyltransferase YrrM
MRPDDGPVTTSFEAIGRYAQQASDDYGLDLSSFEQALVNGARVLRRAGEECVGLVARRRIASIVGQRPSIDKAMGFAYVFQIAGFDVHIQPQQVPTEIRMLLERVQADPPQSIVEIGVRNGGTLFLLATAAPDGAHLVGIDLPTGYAARRQNLYRAFARPVQRVDLLRVNSHDPSTVQLLRGVLDGRPIDLLFIDGDHSYDGVRRDFEMYSPLVADRGLIAFHDIVPGIAAHVEGVPQFWSELKASIHTEELVEDWRQGDAGIGLLRASDVREHGPGARGHT